MTQTGLVHVGHFDDDELLETNGLDHVDPEVYHQDEVATVLLAIVPPFQASLSIFPSSATAIPNVGSRLT